MLNSLRNYLTRRSAAAEYARRATLARSYRQLGWFTRRWLFDQFFRYYMLRLAADHHSTGRRLLK